jgi:DNA polymerase elongation subunit (family B)
MKQVEALTSSDFEQRITKPRILLFDIETAPIVAAVWSYYETNVVWTIEDWYMLGFSAKWLGGKQITRVLPDYKGYKPGSTDDKQLVGDLYDLIESADYVVAHNGDQFDVKKSKARFVKHGFDPISIRSYCTKKMCKRNFGFSSNKLDEVARFLGLGQKIPTDKSLWQGCIAGDMKAWNKMARYNAMDTRLLEQVYLHLRSWDKMHPNLNVIQNREVQGCPTCGSTEFVKKGFGYTTTGRRQEYKCVPCGRRYSGKHQKISDYR